MGFRGLIHLTPGKWLPECVCSRVQWASSCLANPSVHSGKTLTQWIFISSPFCKFCKKPNTPPTILPTSRSFPLKFACKSTKPQRPLTSKHLWSFSATTTYPAGQTRRRLCRRTKRPAAVRWLSTRQHQLPAATTSSTSSWQNDFNHVASRITEVSAHMLSQSSL